jgi:hypothetical protein
VSFIYSHVSVFLETYCGFGRFLAATFVAWGVLELRTFSSLAIVYLGRSVVRTFCSLGYFVVGTFCYWDIMSRDAL